MKRRLIKTRRLFVYALVTAMMCPIQGQQPPKTPDPFKVENPWPELKRGGNGLVPRNVPKKPDQVTIKNRTNTVAGLFVLKFVEGTHIRLIDGQLIFDEQSVTSANGELYRLTRAGLKPATVDDQLEQLKQILERYRVGYGFDIDYLFRELKWPYISDDQFLQKGELEQRAAEELADLDLYYAVYAKDLKDSKDPAVEESFMNELNKLKIVEQVYPVVVTEGADDDPPTRDVNTLQSYLDPAPGGLDGRFAWTRPGGFGDGIKFMDVEYDWVTTHEDFPTNWFWGGRPTCPYDPDGSEHGTAVMGIVAAPHNGLGVTGFAPNVQYGLSTVCRPFDYAWAAIVATFSGENFAGRANNVVVANAIRATLGSLSPGDVLLVEQHAAGPETGRACSDANCSQWEFVPMEYYQECFDVIHWATAQGIVVIEAAGNGGQNLDAPVYQDRFNPAGRNSRAILVGASAGADSTRPAPFTNSSRRVDLFAGGGNVVTLGFRQGSGFPFTNTAGNRRYTNSFGGTSSASAIIAGAVTSYQGIQHAAGNPASTALQVRNALVSSGTPQLSGTELSRPIGRQPNLRAAIERPSPGGFTGPGLYTIQAKSTGKVLDIDVSWFRGQDDGQKCEQWGSHGGSNQQFIIAGDGGNFSMQAVHSGRLLDVAGASDSPGAPVIQYHNTGGSNQLFRFEPVGSFYHIVSTHSGKVLEVAGDSHEDGAQIQQASANGSDNQLFRFIRLIR